MKAVLEWPASKLVKNVQKFLGLANYYKRFVEGFVNIARLLHELMRKEQKWEWEIKQEKSFEVLKKWFTREPVLAALDLDKKMRMEVDVSDYATGGVLLMEYSDGRWKPEVYLSKFLNLIERNYEIHDKEILAVIRGLENWRHLSEGAKFKFKFWMDHKNLEHFMKA